MSLELNSSDQKKNLDEAWVKYKQYIYEVYEPRFYKHKVGRKQEPITPWKDLSERNRVEEQIRVLWLTFNDLYIKWVQLTGDLPHFPTMYVEKETPEGLRWVKESPEAAASYERSLRTPRSQHPS